MRENTTRIARQIEGVGYFFVISMDVVAGERSVHFAEQAEIHPHDRAVIADAIEIFLENYSGESLDQTVIVTDVRVSPADTTDDLMRAGVAICLGELLFGPRGAKIHYEIRDRCCHVFLDEWQLYPTPFTEADNHAEDLSRAVALYLGWKLIPHPHPDETRIIKHFGHVAGKDLVARVSAIASELIEIVPDGYVGYDLTLATGKAMRQITRKYPELDEEARAALAWYYSYEWK